MFAVATFCIVLVKKYDSGENCEDRPVVKLVKRLALCWRPTKQDEGGGYPNADEEKPSVGVKLTAVRDTGTRSSTGYTIMSDNWTSTDWKRRMIFCSNECTLAEGEEGGWEERRRWRGGKRVGR